MTNKHSVTCPQATRTENHRKRLQKWWHDKRWKAYVKEHTEGKRCSVCGCSAGQVKGDRKPAVLTVNHLYRDVYNSFEEYLKFSHDVTEVTCTTCNWMFEKGMNVCPVCISDTVAKYKDFRQPMCNSCFKKAHPEIQAERDRKKAEAKALQQRLRADEKERIKQWKKDRATPTPKSSSEHPTPKSQQKLPTL